MTQVTTIGAGMSDSSVKTKSVSQNKHSKELLAEFAGIMNQSTNSFLNPNDYANPADVNAGKAVTAADRTDALKHDYERFGSSGNHKIPQKQTANVNDPVDTKQVEQLAEDVKETLQECMDVTEEELAQAMETLGMTALDLLQPQNLIGLVQELTGTADVSALLTNAEFQLTMQGVTGLITTFQKETGLSPDGFTDLLTQLSAQIDEMEEIARQLLHASETSQETVSDGQSVDLAQPVVLETKQDDMSAKGMFSQALQTQAAQETDAEVSGQLVETSNMSHEKIADVSANMSEQEESQLSQEQEGMQKQTTVLQDKKEMQTESHAAMFGESQVLADARTPVSESVQMPQIPNYAELEQLLDQFEGLARTFASAEGTSVEMQLNPENLGRMVLTVTEKHGNVTAQIAASNEQVKEALQTQMVELRATLESQGIKVEAVEVTVATHEFEQNLDGNASANGQMQDQSGRQEEGNSTGRRNLRRNELDGLSGLLSEEERLAAQMMQDQGGTVDFTA